MTTVEQNLRQIRITCNALNLEVNGLLGPTNPVPVGGYGGWELQPRPHRVAVTNWAGRNPFTLSLDVLLDGWQQELSQERKIRSLELMALPTADLTPKRPPLVRVHGLSIPHPHQNAAWVIQDLAWGETLRSTSTGDRVRQQVTISLMQHVDASNIEENNIRPGTAQPKYRRYTIKKGDTLQSISRKLLGEAKRWKELAKLNNINDPRHLKVGSHIRVPRK